MKRLHRIFLAGTLLLGAAAAPARAELKVLACEAEWAALATAIGGDAVDASSATTGKQDPHRIEARPSLIAKVRNADLLVCTGLDLEAGWLPVLLQQSGNRAIQPGQPGHFLAGTLVKRLDLPSSLDRSQGDLHGGGNPHIQLDPHNIATVAKALAARLAELDGAHAADYNTRLAAFLERWNAAIVRWEASAAPLRGATVVTHHRDMVYLTQWLGMRELGTLEPKPGLEPTSGHLAELVTQLAQEHARMVLRTPYQAERASSWLADRVSIPAVMIPNTVGGSEEATDLFSLFDDIIARLTRALA